MGLFFDLLSSINNPKQAGSLENLGQFMTTIQAAAHQQGVNQDATQQVVAELSHPLRNLLKNQSPANILSLFSQGSPDSAILSGLVSQFLNPNFLSTLARKTGIPSGQLQTMLPILIPAVIKLFSMGTSQQPSSSQANLSNEVLENFVSDQSFNLGEVIKYSSRLLRPAA